MPCRLPLVLSCALALCAAHLSHVAGARPPNIVVILADDQGWGDLSGNGNTNLSTPNIDSLARSGATFDRFYACSVCAPTRAEFFTGRYFLRTGVTGVSTGLERLNLDESTIFEAFQEAGYATGTFGKWHNGTQHPYHPNARGVDEFYGFCSGHWGHYFDAVIDHNNTLVRGQGYIIDDLTDRAISFMETHREKPFFCYIPYCTPHSPMQVPDRFYDPIATKDLTLHHRDPHKEDDAHLRAALAMCENIDWNVGRILDQLDALGLAEDTVVVYFSDNGPNGWRWNGDMKGKKGDVDEGGLRVPCLMRWPGKIPPDKTIPQIAGATDLLPTLTELAGIPHTGTKPLDGRSLKPLLLEQEHHSPDWPDRAIISARHHGGKASVRTQRFRLDQDGHLFDMVADPGQRHDVATDHPDENRRLAALAHSFLQETRPTATASKDRPFTVGHSLTTPLPARDGIPHGTVRRSNSAPNCSYFTGWSSTDDSITWDIEVGSPGEYEATLYYTCAPEDTGAELELGFAGASVRHTVSEAHDPPLVGQESDRADRGSESFVKDFRPLALGRMHLPSTRGTLTLRALTIPGRSAPDVRYVMLTRTNQTNP
ncbi:arylsulfatase [soil metagenome]